ncbi:hypothetical protein [Shewanella baltica]|uniref:hypothetical protein n=1 Tax=Shewanella baltica TaxID=62322 RepID=UPI00217D40AA|nr:hypothetical protein [Shewanella baltica]
MFKKAISKNRGKEDLINNPVIKRIVTSTTKLLTLSLLRQRFGRILSVEKKTAKSEKIQLENNLLSSWKLRSSKSIDKQKSGHMEQLAKIVPCEIR